MSELEEKTKLAEFLERENEILIQTLVNIIKSCAHPKIAVRCVMVDLKPIRQVLKNVGVIDPELGF